MKARWNGELSGHGKAAELQVLLADATNRKKVGNHFQKMDEQSVVTIKEELSEDFLYLAGARLSVVRRLIEKLDDDPLGTQLQLERFE